MQVTCPNPACGAVYTVGPQHFGKQFPCRSCGAAVTVNQPAGPAAHAGTPPAGGPAVGGPAAGGFSTPASPAGGDAGAAAAGGPSAFASAASHGKALQQQLMTRVKADVWTWALGAGVVVLAIFLFLPMLDRAKVGRRQAKLEAGDQEQKRLDDALARRRVQAAAGKGTAPTAEEDKARNEAREKWQNEGRKELAEDVEDAQVSRGTSQYWYVWGAFVGAMLVTVAGLGYAAAGQTTTRRVVGAVIVCFLVIAYLGAILGKGPVIAVQP